MKGIVKHRSRPSDQCLATEPLAITRQASVSGFFIYLTPRVRRFALRLRIVGTPLHISRGARGLARAETIPRFTDKGLPSAVMMPLRS